MKSRYVLLSLIVGIGGVACGDDDGPSTTTDAGADMTVTPPTPPRPDMGTPPPPPADMGPRDMGMPPGDMGPRDMGMPTEIPTCDAPLEVEGRIGLATATVDTTGGAPGTIEYGDCQTYLDGLVEGMVVDVGENRAQAVIAYHVPGSGSVGIEWTLNNDGTTVTDTIVEVRTGMDCEDTSESVCFDDDNENMTFLSSGTTAAMGGDTIYFVISGFPYADPDPEAVLEGAMQITFNAAENAPPTISGVTAAQAFDAMTGEGTLTVTVMGGDPDGNGAGANITLLTADGMIADTDGDGVGDDNDVLSFEFDESVDGMMTFTGVVTLGGDASEIMATQARVSVFDAFGGESAEMTAPITGLPALPGEMCDTDTPCRAPVVCLAGICRMPVDFGEMCNDTTPCLDPFVCMAGTCGAPARQTMACMAATAVTLDGMGMATVMGTLMPGAGAFTGSCGSTEGEERLFTVTIPGGMGDLVADTAVLGTDEMADTVVYIRSTCVDPREAAESACSDDEDGDTRAGAVVENAPAGTYTIFVEDFGGVADGETTPFALNVRLRPVLAAGAMCDPMGIANRCSGGDCPASGMCP